MTLENKKSADCLFARCIYDNLKCMFEGNRLVHVSPIMVNKLADFIHHGPEYVQLKELSDFYSPFETSPDMYAYEKSCLMKEFWNLAHKALVDGNVSREDIDCCVMEGGIVLR
ncbi:7-methylguanosine phosphate-specific 5'-nucleotidase [Schistosoma japonicum]|nr:7-methylguanosine phosphate-specific 5'-nucleotidase [Schistosoma japonicum]